MKKTFASLIILFISFTSNAQVWIDEGAVWHYDFWNIASEGFYEYMYTGDTLIDGQNCQKIEGSRFLYGVGEPGGGLVFWGESSLPVNYTYVSGDTVFYRNGDEFFVMLNFGATVGDTWMISTTNFWGEGCNDTSYIEVLETGTIDIDGSTYRTITVHPTPGSSYGFSGTFCERFGNLNLESNAYHDLFPHDYLCEELEDDIVVEWDFTHFKCFQDNSFDLYNPSGNACDWWRVNVGVDEYENEKLTVYPNPASELITLNNGNIGNQFTIYTVTGKKMLSGTLQTNTVNISTLNPGTYIIQVESLGSVSTQKIIVK